MSRGNSVRVASVPYVALVVRNVVPFQQRAEFILERQSPVVLLLASDVAADAGKLRGADGKGAVAPLPCEFSDRRTLRFHPKGRASFRFLDDRSEIAGAGQVKEEMNMVVHAADGDRLAIELHEDAAEIGVKFSAEIGLIKERTAVFRGENGVNENLR